jgi:hypothetical protein
LDVILGYIFWNKVKECDWWHWPVEVMVEWLILWTGLHIFYNLILTFIGWEYSYWLIFVFFILILWSRRLVYKILWDKVLTFLIVGLICLPLIKNYHHTIESNFLDWSLDLMFVYFLLIQVMIYLYKKIS